MMLFAVTLLLLPYCITENLNDFMVSSSNVQLTDMKLVGDEFYLAGVDQDKSQIYLASVSTDSKIYFDSFGTLSSNNDAFYLDVRGNTGDVFVSGKVTSNPGLLKYNSTGALQWNKVFGSISDKILGVSYSVQEDKVYVYGNTMLSQNDFPRGSINIFGYQYNSGSSLVTFDSATTVKCLVFDLNGNVFVAVEAVGGLSAVYAYSLQNLQANQNTWKAPIYGNDITIFQVSLNTVAGSESLFLLFSASSISDTSVSTYGNTDFFIYKLDPQSGGIQWKACVGSADSDGLRSSLTISPFKVVYVVWTMVNNAEYIAKINFDDGSLLGIKQLSLNSDVIGSAWHFDYNMLVTVTNEGIYGYVRYIDVNNLAFELMQHSTAAKSAMTYNDNNNTIYISLIIVFSVLIVTMISIVIAYMMRQAKNVSSGTSPEKKLPSANSKNELLKSKSRTIEPVATSEEPQTRPTTLNRSGPLKNSQISAGQTQPPLPVSPSPSQAKSNEFIKRSPSNSGSPPSSPSLPKEPIGDHQKLRKSLPRSGPPSKTELSTENNLTNGEKLRKTNPLYHSDLPVEPPIPVPSLPARQTSRVGGQFPSPVPGMAPPLNNYAASVNSPIDNGIYSNHGLFMSGAAQIEALSRARMGEINPALVGSNDARATRDSSNLIDSRTKASASTNSASLQFPNNMARPTPVNISNASSAIASRRVSNFMAQQPEYSFFEGTDPLVTGPFAPVANNNNQNFHNTQDDLRSSNLNVNGDFQNEFTTTFTQVQTMISSQRELALPGFLQCKPDQDFTIRQQLARGGSGSVFLAKILNQELRYRANGSNLCVSKVLNNKTPSKEEIDSFCQEVSIMWFFKQHRNFAKVLGFSTVPPTIVMKHYPRGSLSDLIYHDAQNIDWTSQLIFFLLRDVATGLKEMHEMGFAHCDIKPGNILIDEDDNGVFAILSDFGISRVVTNSVLLVHAFQLANIDGISVIYAAPEVLRKVAQDDNENVNPEVVKASDVYSFAMVAYETINKKQPWPKGKPAIEIIQKVLRGERPQLSDEVREKKIIDKRLAGLCEIMEQCWVEDPNARLQMKWVTEILDQINSNSLTGFPSGFTR